MNIRSKFVLGAALTLGALLLLPDVAYAQSRPGTRTATKQVSRSLRSAPPQTSRPSRGGVYSNGYRRGGSNRVSSKGPRLGDGTLLRQLAGNNSARLGDGTLLRQLQQNNARLGDGTLLRQLQNGNAQLGDGSLLRQLANEYGYGYDNPARYRYKAEEAHADAYRDAAIANAVVNMVGIIAESATAHKRPVYAQPVAAAPAGHYETRRVLVQPERWEAREIFVPEQRNPQTGEIIEGHYETHKRLVPAVYQETQVWVQH